MTDQCKHCVAKDRPEMCDHLECGVHDSWYSNRLRDEIERLEKRRRDTDMLLDDLSEIVLRLATRQRHDSSWIRPMRLSNAEIRSEYDEAKAIIQKLRPGAEDTADG